MRAWLCFVLALCCAVAVFAEFPTNQLALREEPVSKFHHHHSEPVPEQPSPPVDPEQSAAPVDPEQSNPPVDPEQSTPPVDPEHSIPPADPEQSIPPADPEQPTPADPAPVDPERPSSGSQAESSDEIIMCSMSILECPDNSTASRNAECQYICGTAPLGGHSWDYVYIVKQELLAAYENQIADSSIDTLYSKEVTLTSSEDYSDYCVNLVVYSANYINIPSIYDGVRIFLIPQAACSSKLCPDGSLVDCVTQCPMMDPSSDSGTGVLVPISAILFVIVLSSCGCYMKKRRCQAKCALASNFHTPVTPLESAYPSEQYELILQEEQEFDPSQVAVPMMPPPMMFPPHMMMHPQMMHPQMMHPQMMHPQMMMMHPQMMMYPQINGQMGMPPMSPMTPQMENPNDAQPY